MRRGILILLAGGAVFGQSFDVASVKLATVAPAGAPNSDGGPGTRFPERYSAFKNLRGYLFTAYGLDDAQQQISGPGSIDADKYAIEAKVAPGTTKEQFQIMLQQLLTERFKLAIHHETTVLSVYELVIAKNGPKFKASATTAGSPPAPAAANLDRDGFPALPAGVPGMVANYSSGPTGPVSRWRAQQQPISAFARMLGNPGNAGRVVIDKTGLTGKYDFTLEYADPSDLPGAVQDQLGLKLESKKGPIEMLVVDRAERTPTEN
jgi:uncharacterized protein (TIGR03435 family)